MNFFPSKRQRILHAELCDRSRRSRTAGEFYMLFNMTNKKINFQWKKNILVLAKHLSWITYVWKVFLNQTYLEWFSIQNINLGYKINLSYRTLEKFIFLGSTSRFQIYSEFILEWDPASFYCLARHFRLTEIQSICFPSFHV